jgi:hypothetical protein
MNILLYCWELELRWRLNCYDPCNDERCLVYLYMRWGKHLRSWRVSLGQVTNSGIIYVKEVNAVQTRWRVRGPIVREL